MNNNIHTYIHTYMTYIHTFIQHVPSPVEGTPDLIIFFQKLCICHMYAYMRRHECIKYVLKYFFYLSDCDSGNTFEVKHTQNSSTGQEVRYFIRHQL